MTYLYVVPKIKFEECNLRLTTLVPTTYLFYIAHYLLHICHLHSWLPTPYKVFRLYVIITTLSAYALS